MSGEDGAAQIQGAIGSEATVEEWVVASEEEMFALGEQLAQRAGLAGCLLLVGDLGSGKTTLTKGAARALGLCADQVQSPTYTLINEYGSEQTADGLGRGQKALLMHVDLYRLEPEHLFELGLEEVFAGSGLKVIEWAERLDELQVPPGALWVTLEVTGPKTRRVRVRVVPPEATQCSRDGDGL